MKKELLLDLTRRVSDLIADELPVIVGSQAIFAVTDDVPENVKESIECDYLFASAEKIRRIISELGIFSDFQQTNGVFADPLGLATVVLPAGWRDRLQPLKDDTGETRAFCLELHDAAVSKLMAGREKDFAFIVALLQKDLIALETFVERAASIKETASANALLPRLKELQKHLRKDFRGIDLSALDALIKELSK